MDTHAYTPAVLGEGEMVVDRVVQEAELVYCCQEFDQVFRLCGLVRTGSSSRILSAW